MGSYVLFGDKDYLNAHIHAWDGIMDIAPAFGGTTERGSKIMGMRALTLEEIRNEKDIIVCVGSQKYQQEYFRLTEAGIEGDRICFLDEMEKQWLKQGKIQPAEWRMVRNQVKPQKIRLEICSICQLNCVSCYMRCGADQVYGNGYLKIENFRKILEENQFVREIEISNNGEIFLNPQFEQILEFAYLKGVKLTAEGGANFNYVRDSELEAMVKFQLQDLVIAADGATNETYMQYRRKGDINKVFENIRRLQRVKAKYGSRFPRIRWQYIIMESSEKDIEKAKQIAEELQVELFFKLTWDRRYYPKEPERIKKLTGLTYLNREDYENEMGMPYGPGHPICHELFEAPRINWDGRLFGCCAQHYGDLGVNVLNEGLEQAFKSAGIVYSRDMLCGKVPEADDAEKVPCVRCRIWQKMKKNHWRFCLIDEEKDANV